MMQWRHGWWGAILERTAEFLPALAPLAKQAAAGRDLQLPEGQVEVRVGLRPWGECCWVAPPCLLSVRHKRIVPVGSQPAFQGSCVPCWG